MTKFGQGSITATLIWSYRQGIIGMGVADGVYQWREQGIDAGDFSRLLMQTALEAVEEGQPDVLKGVAQLSRQCSPYCHVRTL